MEIFLPICLLVTVMATGGTLKCPVCETTGRNCDGPMKTCPPEYEQCGIISWEKSFGMQNKTTAKKCIKPGACQKGLVVFNAGKNGTILSHVSCCTGDECKKPAPPLPPRNLTSLREKRTCPACYSEKEVCKEETIECRGEDETHCVELFYQTSDAEGRNVTTTMKGCANKALCDNQDDFATGNLLPASLCKVASGAGRTIEGWSGFLLLSQVQLLFGQVLP